ncbi:ribonuclease H-like domain-containing protein [Favolaschia claudopus]|uniref:Ribonuclease H-like domain-containing protein n=1 Tax=Favolaschia claudopus TaxID=2862362 RepID=A0AAW0AY63_9AGAR
MSNILQPISALDHPKFQDMINIAARATDGVVIPSGKLVREEIIRLFHQQLENLRIRINSDKVTGKLHITCDAWQANNTDGYFVVTGHWIEEVAPGRWQLQEAILGFTRLNNAHHGVRLGQALFKVVQRLGIVKRIGYVTCDNASNNGTMLKEFARQIYLATNETWDPIERRINCLAHVINLATQKLISTHSNSLHFNSHEPDAHIPDTVTGPGILRDEIGLVRAIAVKERSSAKRKELFRTIQLRTHPDVAAKQMILDMKVRWSSTYHMLHRAWDLRRDVDTFAFEIAQEESGEKGEKLEALRLKSEEWARVDLFLNLLACAEEAQHAFSSDMRSTLHLAIPALEKLHAQWKLASENAQYTDFWPALEAAMEKVDEYYQKTADSDAYLLAMVLDPVNKMSYIKANWEEPLYEEATENLEALVRVSKK